MPVQKQFPKVDSYKMNASVTSDYIKERRLMRAITTSDIREERKQARINMLLNIPAEKLRGVYTAYIESGIEEAIKLFPCYFKRNK